MSKLDDIHFGGEVNAAGNVSGGNVITGGLINATGNISGGNLNAAGLSLSGNVGIGLTSPLARLHISGANALRMQNTGFDTLNSSGSFIDSSPYNFAITSSGDAKLSTSQYKFGGASAYFDGVGDYLLISDNNAFELGSSDFTIESFIYFIALPSSNGYQSTIVSKWSTNNSSYEIYLYNNAGTYQLYLTYSTNGTTSTNIGVNWTPNVGQWYHIACVRNSNNIYFWINGIQQGATQSISGTLYNGIAPLEIGGFTLGSTNSVINGYIDEFRITKGIARYTGSFTPPSLAFPNSATQTATKYIAPS